MGETESLVLPMLWEIRGILRDHSRRLDELTGRVSALQHQNVGIPARLDRLEARMDRVEPRLGLVDPGFAEGRSPCRP